MGFFFELQLTPSLEVDDDSRTENKFGVNPESKTWSLFKRNPMEVRLIPAGSQWT